MSEANLDVQKLINQKLEALPPKALASLLAAVVRLCVMKKVFGERSLFEVVANIEAQVKGQ